MNADALDDDTILNIYKTDAWTAHILTTKNGFVQDVEIHFTTLPPFKARQRKYKQRPRVELPEEQTNAMHEIGAWR
jgi:hypothetical protein